MLEALALFGGSFTIALSGALMPGPLFTITIAETARRGFRAGPLLMTGHSLLELTLVVAIILGMGPILSRAPVMAVIALFGGVVLVWLGADMIRHAGRLSLQTDTSPHPQGLSRHPVIMGVLASLANPYWTIWWATIGLGYLVSSMKFGMLGVAIFFLGHISGDFAWYSLVSYAVSRGQRILKDQSYRVLIRVCGVLLLGFG
ncbi:MAG TPA: lysine transporter LysE, partial [Syntrophobacteraceae bacterium]|nr:lysine transporter LysE [Syntrophobacteraceae bacterium]